MNMSKPARVIVCAVLAGGLFALLFVFQSATSAAPLNQESTPTPTPDLRPASVPRYYVRPCNSYMDISGTIQVLNQLGQISYKLSQLSSSAMLTSTTFTISTDDPFSMARGFVLLTQEVTWIGMLAQFFIIAASLIVIIMIVRLVVSSWGIVKRIIDLIELIPGE
jgi:hypothetical protein